MTDPLTIEAAGRTHVGLVRRRNEDAFHLGQWLYVVADGLGGHVAGDVASTTAVSALLAYDRPTPAPDLPGKLGGAVNDASRDLRRKIREQPELAGMGTTLVALLRSGDAAVLANVGDSRAYRMRDNGELRQITEDHTYQHLLAEAMTVPSLPEKLARFLDGRADGRSPDLTTLRLAAGERILLCSDGLSSYVPHELIRSILHTSRGSVDAADRLVAAALDQGGLDNVTVLVIDVL